MRNLLVNTYEINFWNIGDRMCSPVDYFPFLDTVQFHSIGTPARQSTHWLETKYDLLIGGGGLLYQGFRDTLQLMLRGADRSIFWGGGCNTHGGDLLESDCKLLGQIDLVGVRDHGLPFRWVPCASCMHGVFDHPVDKTEDIVVYEHQDYPIKLSGDDPLPRMDNSDHDFGELIRFLGSAEHVVTSSYHGAYWATLLGCKVVVTNAFSSKFQRMRHAPVLTEPADVRSALQKASCYPDALSECRDANKSFAQDVDAFLNSPARSITPLSGLKSCKRFARRACAEVKQSLLQLRSDMVIEDDGSRDSSSIIGKAFYGHRFIGARFVMFSDRPMLFRGIFPGIIREKPESFFGKLFSKLSKVVSPSAFLEKVGDHSTLTGKFGRTIKYQAVHDAWQNVEHLPQELISSDRVVVMTERSPSDDLLAQLSGLLKTEPVLIGPDFQQSRFRKIIDLRGRIFLGQALNILRTSELIIAERGVYREVVSGESGRFLGELKDGEDGRYDVWIRGVDESRDAEVQGALGLVHADS